MLNITKLLGKRLVILVIGSSITLILYGLLIMAFYLKWSSATTVSETIIGIAVAYSMFLYQWLVIYYISPLSRWLTNLEAVIIRKFKLSYTMESKLRYAASKITKVLLRILPIIALLFLLAVDLSYKVGLVTLDEILGGVTGAWAIGIFFYVFGLERTLERESQLADMSEFADSLNNQNEEIFRILYNQPEYVNRRILSASEYFILAHLNPDQFIHIDMPSVGESPQITLEDAQKIVRLRSDRYQNITERWSKGFVHMRRRIHGHLLFATGTEVSISMLMFDNNVYKHEDIIEPFFVSVLPKFDDDTDQNILTNIHNSAETAQRTLSLGNNDDFLDKSIMFSGEAIHYWFLPNQSFFYAWMSIEIMALREFRNEELLKNTPEEDIQSLWIYGKDTHDSRKEDYLKIRYVNKVFRNRSIPITSSNLDVYQRHRNYIAHGAINAVQSAYISENAVEVIKLSRKLIKKTMEQMPL